MPTTAPSRAHRIAAGALAVPAVAAVTILGVWVAGGRISDDFRTSMALTGAWLAVAAVGCVGVARRRRWLAVPVLGAFAVTALGLSAYLGFATLRDRVVAERVVAGVAPAGAPARSPAAPQRTPVEVAAGRFRGLEHATRGRAALVALPDGRRFLTLTRFATAAGPDLRVRLVPGASTDGGASGAIDLGALKGNRGDQQYAVPGGVRVRGRSVVIWCRAFSAAFGAARL